VRPAGPAYLARARPRRKTRGILGQPQHPTSRVGTCVSFTKAIDEVDLDAAHGLAVAFHASIADRFHAPEQVREVIVAIVGVLTGTRPRH